MTSGRSHRGSRWAELWADDAYLSTRCIAPPVDLHAIARLRRVKRLKLQLMVQLGALVPVPGGFEIYIRHPEPQDLDLAFPEPPKLLSPRQRFTFAHEIAHTLFYTGGEGVPVPNTKLKERSTRKYFGIEEVCDRVAKRLLVPTALLSGEIDRKLKDPERIDANFVRSMAAKFRVSYEVTLGRLRVAAPDNAYARCILLVRTSEGEHRVMESYLGASLLSALPALKRQHPLQSWLPEFPLSTLEASAREQCQITRRGRALLIETIPLSRSGDFLMQIDDPSHKAPSSR
jgi:IrrE N-terminal-like domain